MAHANLLPLRAQLQSVLGKQGLKMPAETRAHLSESLTRIDETLKASAQRMAF